jgi:hypothetical protein
MNGSALVDSEVIKPVSEVRSYVEWTKHKFKVSEYKSRRATYEFLMTSSYP